MGIPKRDVEVDSARFYELLVSSILANCGPNFYYLIVPGAERLVVSFTVTMLPITTSMPLPLKLEDDPNLRIVSVQRDDGDPYLDFSAAALPTYA